jgi:glycosyltransferase involved in cell wall biosynthesis
VRILVAHNVSRQRTGGMSRIMGFIHDEIAAAGHQVDWLCAEDVPRRWQGARARFGFPWLVWRTARAAANLGEPYDIINVHEPQGALVALDQRRVSRHGVVVTSHGLERRAWDLALEEARQGRQGPSRRTRLIYPATSLWQSRLALTRARLVFVLNEEDRDYLSDRWGLPVARIGRMRPGASELFAKSASARTYDAARCLVFAGTWRKNKGIEDLVPAFSTLAQRHGDLALVVLGAGVDASVVRAAFPPVVRSRVDVVTDADDQVAARVLASADVFVLPSLFEGTPLTLIEAMMSGLPIVTTGTCGMKDTVQHDVTGLLVPVRAPEEIVAAVERLRGDPDLRRRLGRAAQLAARTRFTWPQVAREVLAAYEELAGRAA